jgi:hypothetical protein
MAGVVTYVTSTEPAVVLEPSVQLSLEGVSGDSGTNVPFVPESLPSSKVTVVQSKVWVSVAVSLNSTDESGPLGLSIVHTMQSVATVSQSSFEVNPPNLFGIERVIAVAGGTETVPPLSSPLGVPYVSVTLVP